MYKPSTAIPRIHPARQAFRLLLLGGCLALAGCSMGETALLDDPLRGGYGQPIATNASTTLGARGVSDGTTSGALPPVNGPTSPAALTNAGGTLGTVPAPADTGAAPGVTVGGPRPSSSRLTPVAAPNGPGAAPQASSVVPAGGTVSAPAGQGGYEQLQQALLARNVTWQQLKTGTHPNEWTFTCSVPNPHDSATEREYTATAVGPFGLAAISAVIKLIDNDARGQ